MVDDAEFGARDRRGDWKPHEPIHYPPAPWRLKAFSKFLYGFPGYFLPWTSVYALVAIGFWFFLTPPMEKMKTFQLDWMAFLLVRNFVAVAVVYGTWYWLLYIRKSQKNAFKLNGRWPDRDNDAFLFKDQVKDNMFWALASAVPFWTAWECFAYWMFANHYVPFVEFASHPVYFVLIMALMPVFHDLHFYVVHRILHWPPLYKYVHHIHHNNVSVNPWSGLAMHPIEHLLYFSGAAIHFVIPSHPLHALYHLTLAGLSPARSHSGFERLVIGSRSFSLRSQIHYLHHKFFECNYSSGPVPVDKWTGTFHDGTDEAQEKMTKRFMAQAKGSD